MTELDRWDAAAIALSPPGQVDLKQWAQEFRDVYQIAEALCKTPFVPREMLNNQATVAAAIMRGRELGLDPFDALGSIYIVHGRVGYYAEFQRRRIIQAGHVFRIIEQTDSRCIVEGVRKDGGEPHRATFTAEQARKAGIDLGKYPADKLVARATSRLCRQVFPDVLSGSLIAEDLIDGLVPADEDAPAQAAAVKAPTQRKRAVKAARAAATQPPATPKPQPDEEIAELLGDEPEPAQPAAATEEAGIDRSDEPGEQEAIDNLHQAGLVEDEPAPAEETPTEDQEPITAAQLRKMSVLFRERGFGDGAREDRLELVVGIIGRDIQSSKQLTKDEASLVIDTLES